jgi:hypothetical protein
VTDITWPHVALAVAIVGLWLWTAVRIFDLRQSIMLSADMILALHNRIRDLEKKR